MQQKYMIILRDLDTLPSVIPTEASLLSNMNVNYQYKCRVLVLAAVTYVVVTPPIAEHSALQAHRNFLHQSRSCFKSHKTKNL